MAKTSYVSVSVALPPLNAIVVALFDSGCDYPDYVEALAWRHMKPGRKGAREVWFIADNVIKKRGCSVLFWSPLPPHPKKTNEGFYIQRSKSSFSGPLHNVQNIPKKPKDET